MKYSATKISKKLKQKFQPTDEQVAVIEADAKPLLVVAGAGSGKTETMAARVVYLVANKIVRPDQILGLTFTRKAAGELAERVRSRLENLAQAGLIDKETEELIDHCKVATYNSFAGSLVRENAMRIGVDPQAKLLGEAAAWQAVNNIVSNWSEDLPTDRGPAAVAGSVLALSGAMAEHLLDPKTTQQQLGEIAEEFLELGSQLPGRGKKPPAPIEGYAQLRERQALIPLVIAYSEYKRDHGYLDFSDQISLAAALAQQCPQVVDTIRENAGAVLLDEFQDTSVAQLKLLASLFKEHNVTAVGDPQQAIYGWRGASASSLETFHDRFGTGQTLKLATSWRNDQSILEVANKIAGPLRKNSEILQIPVLKPRVGANEGQVQLVQSLSDKNEAEIIAKFFAPRIKTGKSGAILCRRRAQFIPLRKALIEAGIPYEIGGSAGLLFEPEILDITAALTLVVDPTAGHCAMRLLTGLNLGPADIGVLYDWAKELAKKARKKNKDQIDGEKQQRPVIEAVLAEAVENPPKPGWQLPYRADNAPTFTHAAHWRVSRLGAQLRELRSLGTLPLPELVIHAAKILGIDIGLQTVGSGRTALDAFIEEAAGYESLVENPTLSGFISWLEVASEKERGLQAPQTEPVPGAVQLLTVHGSKGLEWDVVAVPGLNEQIFPGYLSKIREDGKVSSSSWLKSINELPFPLRGDCQALPVFDYNQQPFETKKECAAAIEEFKLAAGAHTVLEERRLAYVAFTRAKHDLLISCPIFTKGTKNMRVMSRFMEEAHAGGGKWLTAAEGHVEDPKIAKNPYEDEEEKAIWPPDPSPEIVQIQRAANEVLGKMEKFSPQISARVAAIVGEGNTDDVYEKQALRKAKLQVSAALAREIACGATSEKGRALAQEAALLLGAQAASIGNEVLQVPAQMAATKIPALLLEPTDFASSLRRPMPTRSSEKARLGNIFHSWAERWIRAFWAGTDLETLNQQIVSDSEVEQQFANWQEYVRNLPLWRNWQVAAVEEQYEILAANLFIPCRMDLVLQAKNPHSNPQWLVIDWKTGAPPQSKNSLIKAAFQLQQYRFAWAQKVGTELENIDAQLHYVASRQVLTIDQLQEQGVSLPQNLVQLAASIKTEIR